jgi:hypothetical protein
MRSFAELNSTCVENIKKTNIYVYLLRTGVRMGTNSVVAYCEYCGEDQEIKTTVPWQPNLCRTCGNDVEG